MDVIGNLEYRAPSGQPGHELLDLDRVVRLSKRSARSERWIEAFLLGEVPTIPTSDVKSQRRVRLIGKEVRRTGKNKDGERRKIGKAGEEPVQDSASPDTSTSSGSTRRLVPAVLVPGPRTTGTVNQSR